MGVFEYIGVLVSVIMGLGITHLATGATKLIQHRDQVRFYLPHALWTANVLVYILVIWWGMFWWSSHEDWYAYEYLFITLYAVVLFFLAAIGLITRRHVVHLLLPIAWFAFTVHYVLMSIVGEINA